MDKLLCFRGRSTPEAERDADATAWARYVCRAQAFSNCSGRIRPLAVAGLVQFLAGSSCPVPFPIAVSPLLSLREADAFVIFFCFPFHPKIKALFACLATQQINEQYS